VVAWNSSSSFETHSSA